MVTLKNNSPNSWQASRIYCRHLIKSLVTLSLLLLLIDVIVKKYDRRIPKVLNRLVHQYLRKSSNKTKHVANTKLPNEPDRCYAEHQKSVVIDVRNHLAKDKICAINLL